MCAIRLVEMPDDLDTEALLAAAAQRMSKLGRMEAAVALADSSVRDLDWVTGTRHAEIYLVVGGDHYDALKAPNVWSQRLEHDDNGEEVWAESLVRQVFLDVLPPGTRSCDVHAAIRNDPVSVDWRELDRLGMLRPAPRTVIAHLDPSTIPTDSDLLLHLGRLNRLDQEPEEMIGAAKDLVEATAKLVLYRLEEPIGADADVAAVSKQALKQLNLHPEVIAPTTKGADTMKRILGGLQQIAAGLAELRNMGYGTGHGRGRRVAGLGERHAELAARSASAYVAFVLATLNEPNAPWTRKRAAIARVPAKSVPAAQAKYSAGQRVRHARWGDGIIVASKLTRSDEELTIAFKDATVGRKTMIASLANLEVVE
jgi:hypothetical protein